MKTINKSKSADIQKIIKRLRNNGITSEQIAYELGVSFGAIKSWESGIRKPRKATLMLIERVYGAHLG